MAGSAYSNIAPHVHAHSCAHAHEHVQNPKSPGVWWQAATVSTPCCNSVSYSLSLAFSPKCLSLSLPLFISTPSPSLFFFSLPLWPLHVVLFCIITEWMISLYVLYFVPSLLSLCELHLWHCNGLLKVRKQQLLQWDARWWWWDEINFINPFGRFPSRNFKSIMDMCLCRQGNRSFYYPLVLLTAVLLQSMSLSAPMGSLPPDPVISSNAHPFVSSSSSEYATLMWQLASCAKSNSYPSCS